jgi:CBS domain containing-hemolysin-like protein
MQELLVQLGALGLAAVMVVCQSVRFVPSEVTEFELERRIKSGKKAAELEARLRRDHLLLVALQRFVLLILVIGLVGVLSLTHPVLVACLLALVWLVLVQFVATRPVIASFTEEVVDRYMANLLRFVTVLRPVLHLVASDDGVHACRATFYSREELLHTLEHDHGVLNKGETVMVRQVLTYATTTVKELMVPRVKVVVVEQDDIIGPVLLNALHKSGLSSFPVEAGSLDKIVGFVRLDDVLPIAVKAKTVADVMSHRVFYVNQDLPLEHVLQAFLRTGQYMFIVINESGRTTGVITIETIIIYLLGHMPADGFDQYEDVRAVAMLAVTARQASHQSKHAS